DYGCLRTDDRWKMRSLPGSFPIFVARVDCLTVHLLLASSRKRAGGLAPSTLTVSFGIRRCSCGPIVAADRILSVRRPVKRDRHYDEQNTGHCPAGRDTGLRELPGVLGRGCAASEIPGRGNC